MNKEYIFIVIDKEDNKEIKSVTTNVEFALKSMTECYDIQLEVWQDNKWVDGCGINVEASVEDAKDILRKYKS